MYINPFWAGVFVTIDIEAIGLVIISLVMYSKRKK